MNQTEKLDLTPEEKAALQIIKKTVGPTLRKLTPGLYRLMDATITPVRNFRTQLITDLVSKGYIKIKSDNTIQIL